MAKPTYIVNVNLTSHAKLHVQSDAATQASYESVAAIK